MSDPLKQIQQLIALAGSDNENEARNAAYIACKLIRQHKVELHLPGRVRVHDLRTVLDDIMQTPVRKDPPVRTWKPPREARRPPPPSPTPPPPPPPPPRRSRPDSKEDWEGVFKKTVDAVSGGEVGSIDLNQILADLGIK